jgi:hypothetical protein
LGTLGKALGAGGLVLPWAGRGALALPADLGQAAHLPLTAAPMPFSADCLQLRDIKRALAALPNDSDLGHADCKGPWHRMMTHEYRPAERRLYERPVKTWTDCVELAETIWAFWSKEHEDGYCVGPVTGRLCTSERDWSAHNQRHAIAALVQGVLTLGGGERFDPRTRAEEVSHG